MGVLACENFILAYSFAAALARPHDPGQKNARTHPGLLRVVGIRFGWSPACVFGLYPSYAVRGVVFELGPVAHFGRDLVHVAVRFV